MTQDTQNTQASPATAQNADEQRQARLVGLQDDNGYHLCIGFVKDISPEGVVSFEDEGQKILSYGAYEVAIQDLENCLAHVKAMLAAKQQTTIQ